MRRLFYGGLARATHYHPYYKGHEAQFILQLQINYRIEGLYEAATFEGIIEQVKTDGYQIWGQDILDYAIPPRNALEYKLMEVYMQQNGYTSEQITEAFSLSLPTDDDPETEQEQP